MSDLRTLTTAESAHSAHLGLPRRPTLRRRAPRTLRIASLAATLLTIAAAAAGQTPITEGFKDFTYPDGIGTDSRPAAEKPESKLWFQDGIWWGVLWSTAGDAYHIHRLDLDSGSGTFQSWIDTGTAVDDRSDAKVDALWDGSTLYVATHISSIDNGTPAGAGERGELYRFTYTAASKSYALDGGFPVEITLGKSETLVLAKDSTGQLWVAYVEDSEVMVNRSLGSDTSWGVPFALSGVLPAGQEGFPSVTSDAVASVFAYDGGLGVMWDNQDVSPKTFYFARHPDASADLSDWTAVAAYSVSSDDHINVKVLSGDSAGEILAAVKTSDNSALILVLVCASGTNCTSETDWSSHTVWDSTFAPTRPILQIDTSGRRVYVISRNKDADNDKAIYMKSAPLDAISFTVAGIGTPIIRDLTTTRSINDATSTKETLNATSGLVVLGNDEHNYYHAQTALVGPVAEFSGTPTVGIAPLSVDFTDESTGSPTSWSWAFGDGGVSSDPNPTHEYSTAGTYSVSLTVTNAVGDDTETKTDYIAVNPDPTTTTTITSNLPNPSVVGQSVTVTYTVTTAAGGSPTGNVTVSDGTTECTGTVAAGACSLAFPDVGLRTLVATYAGDGTFNGSTSSGVSQNVNKAPTTTTITGHTPDPSVTGQGVTVSFTVDGGGGTPTGTVTVVGGGANCNATVAVGSCVLSFTTASLKNISATYAGDANYTGSTSSSIPHQVDPAATSTAITADAPDPSIVGTPVTVSFAVTVDAPGGGTPLGNVTVGDGVSSCTASVTDGSCALTLQTLGARTLTATYAGDVNFTGSTSPGEAHQVNPDVPPSLAVTPLTLNFGAVSTNGVLTPISAPQTVVVTEGGGPFQWTATPSHAWIQVSPTTGSDSGTFTVSIVNNGTLPPSGPTGGFIAVSGGGAPQAIVGITITTFAPGSTGVPFGVIDTPAPGASGLTGAVGVTGWVLDDVQVTRVQIFREAVPPEAPGLVFLGDAVLIDGARPDVAAANPTAPFNTRAGWGFMVLTNMLPNQGNGTYTLHVFAEDIEGQSVLLGTRTFSAANATAVLPFGTIDTPGQGETIGGSGFTNFGWALTPLPKTIPVDGSTINVFIDGVDQGNPTYNNFRSDIAALFPGLANSNGAIGFQVIDTTAFANGVHTIAWGVTDDQGAASGLGSRFFTILNGGGAASGGETGRWLAGAGTTETMAAPLAHRTATVAISETARVSGAPLLARAGFGLDLPPVGIWPAADGVYYVRAEALDRLEILLGRGPTDSPIYSGTQLTADGQAGLPLGSHLDATTGRFTWQPGVGFTGRYDFLFARLDQSGSQTLFPVQVLLTPQYQETQTTQMWIDLPMPGAVTQPFSVAGWAIDQAAVGGSGVDAVHVWAFPNPGSGEPPFFLGAATIGGTRPDVAALYGPSYGRSGYGLTVYGLNPGTYDLVAYAHSTATGQFNNAKIVRIVVP